jgi:carbamoyl-phosphate synthase large subunit
VAPSQTLSNREYFKLRSTALKVIRHIGIVGECNIQYALDPKTERYCIIEVNARLSRSSALASKATGYPLAYVAAKLSLGQDLVSIRNSVTGTTTACFEPSLDYCVVKMPRWDMRKFQRVDTRLGSGMKSVGEVMAIGRSFEEALQKAVRMVRPGSRGLEGFELQQALIGDEREAPNDDLAKRLRVPTDQRLFAVQAAFERGVPLETVHDLTRIDRWFLSKMRRIARLRAAMEGMSDVGDLDLRALRKVKQAGFSDDQVAHYTNCLPDRARRHRLSLNLRPVVKQIDTLGAEFPACTNYLYMTYHGDQSDVQPEDRGVMVLGCGAYCIGSSVEFDWSAVSCVRQCRASGYRAVVVNYNPETVSTDYDVSDRLYFEELSLERVLDIYEQEQAWGLVVSVGGQIPQNLAKPLHDRGARVLGTSPDDIDRAEDRHKFSSLLDDLGVDQPPWRELQSVRDAQAFAAEVQYPVLVRPSFVLSGAAMKVATSDSELAAFLGDAADVSPDHPVVVSKFIRNAKEIEFDAVCRDGSASASFSRDSWPSHDAGGRFFVDVEWIRTAPGVGSGPEVGRRTPRDPRSDAGTIMNYAISEHVENAGVHSGDATLVLPAQKLYVQTQKQVRDAASGEAPSTPSQPCATQVKRAAAKIAEALNISGPVNIQFMARDNDVKVIECNLRASRSFPFISKTMNCNFISR